MYAGQRRVARGKSRRQNGLAKLDCIAAHYEFARITHFAYDVDRFRVVGDYRNVYGWHANILLEKPLKNLLNLVLRKPGDRDIADVVVLYAPVKTHHEVACKFALIADIHMDDVITPKGIWAIA